MKIAVRLSEHSDKKPECTDFLPFSDHLRLIDERAIAFRTAVAAAPSLDVPVPSCPEWTLFDLVQHLGVGTWWADSQSPQTSGAWARRQVPEIAAHTHDVQLTVGAPQPLPDEAALDGFDDCQFTRI